MQHSIHWNEPSIWGCFHSPTAFALSFKLNKCALKHPNVRRRYGYRHTVLTMSLRYAACSHLAASHGESSRPAIGPDSITLTRRTGYRRSGTEGVFLDWHSGKWYSQSILQHIDKLRIPKA